MALIITRETLEAIPDPVARLVAEDLIRRGEIRLTGGDPWPIPSKKPDHFIH
jgi:hypothetical protein